MATPATGNRQPTTNGKTNPNQPAAKPKIPTAQDLATARAEVQRLEKAVQEAQTVPNDRAQEMIETGTPPMETKSWGTDSQPFNFHNFLRAFIAKDERMAPHEAAICKMYKSVLDRTGCALSAPNVMDGGIWLPINLNETYGGKLTSSSQVETDFRHVKAVMGASTRPTFDPDEAAWLRRKGYIVDRHAGMIVKSGPVNTSSQSAYDDGLGSDLVTPPIQGEVIPLIRPQAGFLAAGAQAMTLPPNGRYVAPRIMGAPGVESVGESQDITVSQLTTDQMNLTAKKIAGAVRLTAEGTQFTSGTLDSMCQMELGRSLGLQLDGYAWYGQGSTSVPFGLTSNEYSGLVLNVETSTNPATSTCKGIGTNGNQLLPQYGDYFPAFIGQRSFNMDAGGGTWVMAPMQYASAVGLRADAVAAGDQAGVLVDVLRRFGETSPNMFRGRKVVQTTNLKLNNTKGSGTGLSDVFFGMFQYAIFASYAAIQFTYGHDGVSFLRDQVILKGTMYGDIGFQYPSAFLWFPNVQGFGPNF